MAPTVWALHQEPTSFPHHRRDRPTFGNWRDVDDKEAYILEGWGEGFMFGALLIMVIITVANMRKGVLLHKVILLEVSDELSRRRRCIPLTESVAACDEPWHLLLHVISWLWVLSLVHGSTSLLLLFHA